MSIKLKREDIAANAWDAAHGAHYLVVGQDGSIKITWAEDTRQWNPWQDGDYVAMIPAVFPDGSGAEIELAEDLLRDVGQPWDLWEEEYDGPIQKAEALFPEKWEEYKDEAVSFVVDEFMEAINCDPDGTRPWGSTGEWAEEAIECPFSFEWA